MTQAMPTDFAAPELLRPDPLRRLRLLIVSHAPHYQFENRLYAYGPYVREIDLWADLFREAVIAAPYQAAEPPGDYLPFRASNISVAALTTAGGETLTAKIKLALAVPSLMAGLARAMRQADAIHVRCPGNVGLLGAILAPLFSRRLVAKYAAHWGPAATDPWSSRFQKAVLRSNWWRGPVTVYGEWQNQPHHVVPFFTSLLSAEYLERARVASGRPRGTSRLHVLYTGRISRSKNVDVLLHAISRLRAAGRDIACTIIGEGPERLALTSLAAQLGLSDLVEFTGGVDFDSVINYLERADVLVLTSETEGWPKSIAEGMAFGLVCVGSNRGFVSQMLSEGRGVVVEPRDVETLAAVLSGIAQEPEKYSEMCRRAADWAQQYSLDGLKQAIHALLLKSWENSLQPQCMSSRFEPAEER